MNESTLEEVALDWLRELGYTIGHGPDLAPGEAGAERASYGDVVLEERLRESLWRLNPDLPQAALEEAMRKLLLADTPSLIGLNRRFHALLRDGVTVEVPRQDGSTGWEQVRVIDFNDPAANEWLALNQFTVVEDGHTRRMDVVVFVNGLPLAIIELKNPGDENADVWKAFNQLQTYKREIPSLFHYNELLVISDGVNARLGSLTANREWFKMWRTVDGGSEAAPTALQLETLIQGVFEPDRFLRLLDGFIAFEEDPDTGEVHKILAGYHQFHAVKTAVRETVRASGMDVEAGQIGEEGTFWAGEMRGGETGDRRAGVVWHTQGSGKSLSMLFFAGRIIQNPAMKNPTIVVITDRNDLDDQLYGQFLRCHELLRQKPVQAENRAHMRDLLSVASGGVIFTTIQKFMPEEKGDRMQVLSDRENIVVIADEAHRSQYALIGGLARHLRDALPNASFIGFTGTPIEKTDANTRAVFGDYVSVYDIQRAVEDKSTVPIYYESRIAKLSLNEQEIPRLDDEFETITEDEEVSRREKLKTKWAALEALVGSEKRIRLVARDLVDHFERRQRGMEGKAMVVCMSRRICAELYQAIIDLRPEWEGVEGDNAETEADKDCVVKVVMTGSASDPADWQRHVRTKRQRKDMALRFKNPKDPFRIVLVRDMWLTGFDAPCLHTMYADKPMQGHGLMQAIARVNRVFRDKPGGLVVDYLGLADQLKRALATYTESGGRGQPTYDEADAVAALLEKFEVCCAMLHPLDWSSWHGDKAADKLKLIPEAQERILEQENGKARFTQTVTDLSRAFALCATAPEAEERRDDIAYFQAIRAALMKQRSSERAPEEIDAAIRQLVSSALVPGEEVIDVFTAAGMERPDISILSDGFLAEVQGLKHKNVAAELLKKLLKDEVRNLRKRNVVQGEKFSDRLQKSLKAYHNRAISSQEIIEELIRLAKEMRAARERGDSLGLTEDEVTFYDALANNESAVKAMGNDELKVISAELVTKVRQSVTIDWTVRENARAKIRVMVRRILNKHGYPPDLQEEAVKTVLRQAEALCGEWVEEEAEVPCY